MEVCLFQEGSRGGYSSSGGAEKARRSPVDLCVMVFRSINRSGGGPLVGKHVGHSKRQVCGRWFITSLQMTELIRVRSTINRHSGFLLISLLQQCTSPTMHFSHNAQAYRKLQIRRCFCGSLLCKSTLEMSRWKNFDHPNSPQKNL